MFLIYIYRKYILLRISLKISFKDISTKISWKYMYKIRYIRHRALCRVRGNEASRPRDTFYTFFGVLPNLQTLYKYLPALRTEYKY